MTVSLRSFRETHRECLAIGDAGIFQEAEVKVAQPPLFQTGGSFRLESDG
jgi:hypothetical protein